MTAKEEENMDGTITKNMPVTLPTHVSTGLFTTGNLEAPQGQVMKLELPKLTQDRPEEQEQRASPVLGVHIREGIAVVKDWMKKS